MSYFTVTASVFFLLALTIERYLIRIAPFSIVIIMGLQIHSSDETSPREGEEEDCLDCHHLHLDHLLPPMSANHRLLHHEDLLQWCFYLLLALA